MGERSASLIYVGRLFVCCPLLLFKKRCGFKLLFAHTEKGWYRE